MFIQNLRTTILDGDKYVRLVDVLVFLSRVRTEYSDFPDAVRFIAVLEKKLSELN
jgi:hypothetical protein